jgi:hypothetical protein
VTPQLLDAVPVVLVYLLIGVGMLIAFEIGFRVGNWHQQRSPEEKEGPTGMLVGALLALMAFILAIVVGMAVDRFDTRRGLVVTESNSIGTTYLRAGYLADTAASLQVRNLLREYVPLRIATTDPVQLENNRQRSGQLMNELWAITEGLVKVNPNSESMSLFVETVNDTIDVQLARVTAADARVPQPIILFVLLGSILSIGLVGYQAGLSQRRSLIAAFFVVVLFSTVISLIVDLNQPASGFFTVSQQPLITLQQQIGPPA